MINVRIKLLPPSTPGGEPRAVTQKLFLRSGAEMATGCRPLEPGEIVALEDDEALNALSKLPYELERTELPPTRPLYFRNLDEANMTSQFFNPNSAGRAEQAKKAMQQMWEDAKKPENAATMEVINDLEQREAAIAAKEIELGLRKAPENFDEIDKELEAEGVEAANNTTSNAELKDLAAEADDSGREAAAEIKPGEHSRVSAAIAPEPEPTPPAARRRRRQVAAQ